MPDNVYAARLATRDDAAVIVEFNLAMARETESLELSPATLASGVRNLFDNPHFGFYVVAEARGAGGAVRLRLPREKGRNASLACSRYPACQAVRWFDEGGALQEPRPAPETGPECAQCGTPTVKRGPTSAGSHFWSCPRWRSDGTGCNSKPVWINERV